MEAIGQLTGGIAHDFNNMLSIVIGNIELLKNHVKDDAGSRRAKLALDGALRCANMTQRLLTFARRQPLQQKTIDLNEFVDSTCDLLRRMLPENIEISFAPVDDLWAIRSDPTQVEAAIVNLAVNARDAMEGGGRITITLKNVPWSEFPDSPTELEPGDFVMIEVGDSGTGIQPEVLARVFEPFFTTKEIGKGTGLGLATTYGFVKQSGGHVAIDSALGEGTRVRLFLPRDRRAAPPREQQPAEQESEPAKGETILVVEDESAVREVAVTALSRLGYTVLEASSAEHGLELLEREPNVRLLFTDILMPGPMGGRELAREALRRRPDLKVLYASGYGGADAGAEDAGAMMRKPYLGQELAGRVRALLAHGAPALHAGAA
jgi:CheY-like chemotaxis protein